MHCSWFGAAIWERRRSVESLLHINLLELRAIHLALKAFFHPSKEGWCKSSRTTLLPCGIATNKAKWGHGLCAMSLYTSGTDWNVRTSSWWSNNKKIRTDRAQVTLVTPDWAPRVWHPELLDMSICPTIRLPFQDGSTPEPAHTPPSCLEIEQ